MYIVHLARLILTNSRPGEKNSLRLHLKHTLQNSHGILVNFALLSFP